MNSRVGGLLFIGIGAGIFGGINGELLPPELVWVGLALAGFGFFRFMKANRKAMRVEERRLEQALHPRIDLKQAKAYNERMARRAEELGVSAAGPRERQAAISIADAVADETTDETTDELVLYEVDDAEATPVAEDFKISSDVSFPVEVQESRNLSEEIARLRRLHEDGVITAEEFHIAKAKLLA
ncbi:MAG: SHOCT domain-containing protein [Myxococcota bacterium]